MKDFFKKLREITGDDLPSPGGLTTVEKSALAQRLYSRGISVKEIAEYFECSVPYVYKLKREAVKEEASELECQTFFDSFMDRRQMLLDQIEFYKVEQQKLRCGPKALELDEETGEYKDTGKKGSTREFAEIGRLIQKYEQMLIALEDTAGILPNKTVVNIFGTINDMKEKEDSNDEVINDEQATAILLKKLRSASVGVMGLKEMKDERIL